MKDLILIAGIGFMIMNPQLIINKTDNIIGTSISNSIDNIINNTNSISYNSKATYKTVGTNNYTIIGADKYAEAMNPTMEEVLSSY